MRLQREQASKKQRVQTGVGMPGADPAAVEHAADVTVERTDGGQLGPSALRFDVPTGMSEASTSNSPAVPSLLAFPSACHFQQGAILHRGSCGRSCNRALRSFGASERQPRRRSSEPRRLKTGGSRHQAG